MYGSLNQSGFQVLKFLTNNSTKEHSLSDINVGISYKVPIHEIEEILQVFHQAGYITQLFIVDDLLDIESRAENRYKITSQGELFFLEQEGYRKHGQPAIADLEEDYPDADEEKRKRRNMLIGFALILIIALATVILVPILNG
ncbi:MAG: hypothetical protein ACTSXA_09955 [Candidatus Heimdallarchaeota archaeon]